MRLRAIAKQTYRGLTGHPGTPVLLILAGFGYLAGSWAGLGIMLLIYGPIYLYGAWERGKS